MMKALTIWLNKALSNFRVDIVPVGAVAGGTSVFRIGLPSLNLRWLQRAPALLGRSGIAAVALLIGCVAFYFSTLQQAQEKLSAVRNSVLQQQSLARQDPQSELQASDEQIVQFYRAFPQDRELPQCMEKIFAAAQRSGIELAQGEYKVNRDGHGGLVLFQMAFPVNADYPQIRKYLIALKADIPTLSLQQVQFKRQKVGDARVEANIRMVLYLQEKKS